jgi:hypothetical protein
VGALEFRSTVLEGTVVGSLAEDGPAASAPEGVTVVATAMRLSAAARRRLSDEFGADYIVVDIHAAPETTDVLLTHPVSPQLVGLLKHQFPAARIVITEIEDEELGVSYAGPVSRMLDAGASAYLPPRPIAELAANVHTFLTRGGSRCSSPAAPRPGRSRHRHARSRPDRRDHDRRAGGGQRCTTNANVYAVPCLLRACRCITPRARE